MVVMEVPQFMGEDAAHFVHGKLRKEPSKDDDMMVAKSVGIELRRVFDIERKVTAPKARFLEHWVKAGFNVGKVIAFGFARAFTWSRRDWKKENRLKSAGTMRMRARIKLISSPVSPPPVRRVWNQEDGVKKSTAGMMNVRWTASMT